MKKDDIDNVQYGLVGFESISPTGIPRRNLVVVEGAPGSGKTTLALQYIVQGILKFKEAGVFVTFEHSPEKLRRDARSFGWDLQALEERQMLKIIYTSPEVLLNELNHQDNALRKEIEELSAKRIAIDGLAPLRMFSERQGQDSFRVNLHLLGELLLQQSAHAVITSEGQDKLTYSDEHFIADSIIHLGCTRDRKGLTRRFIELVKSRGHDFVKGRHAIEIEEDEGVRVYPRAEAIAARLQLPAGNRGNIPCGVEGLSELFGGDLIEGSITLAVGITGTGKTSVAATFIAENLKKSRKCAYLTLDEPKEQVLLNNKTIGIDFQPYIEKDQLKLIYENPLEIEPDIHFARIKDLVENEGIDCFVIDSISCYDDELGIRAESFTKALSALFKSHRVTAFLTLESQEMIGISQISRDYNVSVIADNIILLTYVETSAKLRRAITVPKARASRTIGETRELSIDSKGCRVISQNCSNDMSEYHALPQLPFSSYYGVLGKTPNRLSPYLEKQRAKSVSS